MSTRLELAENKLIRLESELELAQQSAYAHMRQTNGQPMNDKRGGASFFKTRDQLENRVFAKMHEIEAQKERIEKLKEQEFNREHFFTSNGGVSTCVQNIDVLKERKQTADVRRKVDLLESIKSKHEQDTQLLSENASQLITSGSVVIWEKKPIYYFVKGLKKVALVVDKEGNFILSKTYPTKTDDEKQFVYDLLQTANEPVPSDNGTSSEE